MLKSLKHFILLFVWMFAILAPPVVSMLEDDNKTFVTLNLNEEEQQEQGKTDIDENLIVEKKGSDFSLLSILESSLSCAFYVLESSEHISKIFLPPPEHTV